MENNIVYLLTCVPTGEKYVGQSRRAFYVRWNEHQHKALVRKKGGHLGERIREHGPASFMTQVIEENIPGELLNERERYWIEYYNTMVPHGLNETKGGDSPVSPTGVPLPRGGKPKAAPKRLRQPKM